MSERLSWRDLPARGSRAAVIACVLVAVVSGAMWVLASADFDIWPLAYVAMVPGLWLIERAPTRRRALLYGWISGLSVNALGFYWITELLTRHADLPWVLGVLALLLLSAYQALVFLLFAAAVRGVRQWSAARRGRPLPMVVIAPLAMVTFELLVPFIFPWYLAVSQAWVAPVIQIAELTGPLGVTFVLMAVNGALADLLLAEKGPRDARWSVVAAAALVAVVLGFGLWRMRAMDEIRAQAPALRVGLVQSNIPLDPEHQRPPDELLADLQEVSAELERAGAGLLVWPESSYPYGLARSMRADFPAEEDARIRRGFSVPLVLGAITFDVEEPDRPPYNSALMLDASGAVTGLYDKIHLLIFGEYIPGVETFPFIRDLLPSAAGHLSRGHRLTSFPFAYRGAEYRLAPIICYEDILTGIGRDVAAHEPHLLVNITNDTWFGDTAEPWQHLALSVFRTVELRTEMVRAVNTGVSAHIDAAGRVRMTSYVVDPARSTVGATGHLAEVALIEGGDTFYARFGDVFGYACALALVFVWLVWPAILRRRGA